MGTLLDNIARTPEVLNRLVEQREINNRNAMELISNNFENIHELVLIGSGSSYNEAKAARGFIEKVTGIRTVVETSNDFIYNHNVFDMDSVYVFLSQSGTSETTRRAQKALREKGCHTIAVTANTEKYISQEAEAYIDAMCAHEEYHCVTMGFCSSLLALELFGLSIAENIGKISKEQADSYINDLNKAISNYPVLMEQARIWFEANEKKFMDADLYYVFGADDLWGIAREGALKILEIPKLYAAGWELEDGTHGPCLAFNERVCNIILNDGQRENDRALILAKFVKCEFDQGFVFGSKVYDENDLKADIRSNHFQNIEFACLLQTVCWYMSLSAGVDLAAERGIKSRSKKYFATHTLEQI